MITFVMLKSSCRKPNPVRNFPMPRAFQLRPAEGFFARALLPQTIQPLDAFIQRWLMAGLDPPQHQRHLDRLEPIFAPGKELAVHRLPDEALQRLDIFPDG